MTKLHLALLATVLVAAGIMLNGMTSSEGDEERNATQSSAATTGHERPAAESHSPKRPDRAGQTTRPGQSSTPPPSISGSGAQVTAVPPTKAGSPTTHVPGPNRQGSVSPMHPSAPREGGADHTADASGETGQPAGVSAIALAAQAKTFTAGRKEAMKERLAELAAHQPGCKCATHLGEH